MDPLLPMERVEVFFDVTFSEPRLRHPEGVAIDKEGNVWCGGEGGDHRRGLLSPLDILDGPLRDRHGDAPSHKLVLLGGEFDSCRDEHGRTEW
jgi:hypothetical protein